MTAIIVRGDALALPLPDESVDLICTSPPYWSLRSYTDGGEHFEGQLGSEPTPAEFVESLVAATREMVRVLKPTGSAFINLGDKFSSGEPFDNTMTVGDAGWLAGLIDADGTITVRFTQQPTMRAPTFEGIVAVEQMDRSAVERAAAITGQGRIHEVNGSRGRPMYRWTASTQQARWVVERIWPWLRIKQRQALAIAELGRHREQCQARGRYAPIKPEWIEYRQLICSAVRAWNARQPHDWEPPLLPVIELPIQPRRVQPKSLTGLPWRYALACIDQLGLILRAEIVLSKVNGLPESVTDRVRRSHEQVFHFVKQPRYYSAVDEIREGYNPGTAASYRNGYKQDPSDMARIGKGYDWSDAGPGALTPNPLGKLPGSVWEYVSEPLQVPDHLGVDHFAAFATALPRRIIRGWSPRAVCSECGFLLGSSYDYGMLGVRRANNSRAPERVREAARAADESLLRQEMLRTVDVTEPCHDEVPETDDARLRRGVEAGSSNGAEVRLSHGAPTDHGRALGTHARSIRSGTPQERNQDGQPHRESGTTSEGRSRPFAQATSEALRVPSLWRSHSDVRDTRACPHCGSDQLQPSVIVDPFSGTGTTALVASMLGRIGIGVDLSYDYCRLGVWRTTDPGERARALQVPKPPPVPQGQSAFDFEDVP